MRRFIFISIISLLFVTVVMGQRRITPVEVTESSVTNDDKKSSNDSLKGKKRSKSLIVDGFESDSAWVDSTVVVFNNDSAKIVYPLLNGISLGVNIWDPVMRALGQEYGLIDFSGEVNLYNRFFPAVEVGFGAANSTPETGNFTYNVPMSLYAKIGGGYNFLYSKNSDYKLIAGFRLGFSSFNYEIVDAVISDGYWDESSGFSILDQSASALWGEFNLGVRVNIYNNWSMGWMLRVLRMFSCTENEYSSPGYIPGYGKSSSSLSGSFSLFYTIPLKSKIKPKTYEVDEVVPHNHNHSHDHNHQHGIETDSIH